MASKKKIMMELKNFQDEMKTSTTQSIEVTTVRDNIYHWKGTIYGPKGTCYEGGTFIVDI